jgi:hypothetical protein
LPVFPLAGAGRVRGNQGAIDEEVELDVEELAGKLQARISFHPHPLAAGGWWPSWLFLSIVTPRPIWGQKDGIDGVVHIAIAKP